MAMPQSIIWVTHHSIFTKQISGYSLLIRALQITLIGSRASMAIRAVTHSNIPTSRRSSVFKTVVKAYEGCVNHWIFSQNAFFCYCLIASETTTPMNHWEALVTSWLQKKYWVYFKIVLYASRNVQTLSFTLRCDAIGKFGRNCPIKNETLRNMS